MTHLTASNQLGGYQVGVFWLACLAVPLAGCDWPQDGKGTLQAARGGTLRVGVMQGPPWAELEGEHASGIEVQLVREFCRELGCRVQWVEGGETELMSALEHFEIDLVIGGVTRDTPWRKRVGLSRAFLEARLVVAVPAGQPELESIDGVRVLAPPGKYDAALVRSKGGIPVGPEEPPGPPFAVAIEDWQIPLRNLKRCPVTLEKRERAWAVPPGENAWLFRVDRFLQSRRPSIPRLAAGLAP